VNKARVENEPLIDVNVNLSRWPTRRCPDDETELLARRLGSHGVVEAWAGTFDGLLHKDVAAANTRLSEECRVCDAVRLVPFGTVNPMLPDWEEDLRRCDEVHHMPGIRLHPNYHGYELEDPSFVRLLQIAAARGLIVQLALEMEDQRMMHPQLRVPPVDPMPLEDVVPGVSGLRLVLLNSLRTLRGEDLVKTLSAGLVSVEIAWLEGLAGLERLLSTVSHERVLFGSHAPSFSFEAARLKLQESELAAVQLRAITHDNARLLLRE
jgi:predicted TIM-barrel fold metal-dependent hydrolase